MPLRRKPSGGSSHKVLLFGSNTQLRKRRLIGARRSRSHLNKGQRFSVVAYQINFALCTARNVVPRDKHAANTNTQMSPTHSPSPRFSFAFASVPLPRSVRVVRATSPAQIPAVKIAPPRFPKTKVSPSKWPIKGIAFACEYNLVSRHRRAPEARQILAQRVCQKWVQLTPSAVAGAVEGLNNLRYPV
jgi:hypothetical protein